MLDLCFWANVTRIVHRELILQNVCETWKYVMFTREICGVL